MREFSMMEAEIFFDPNNKNHEMFESVKDELLYLFDNIKDMKLTLGDAVNKQVINNQALAYYMYLTQSFLLKAGVDPKRFRFRKHADDELAHYAKECWDAELYSERFGWVECVGIADRSAYDLNAHIQSSGTDMYALRRFDEPQKVKIKKIEPDMSKLGPLFKEKAGKIKQQLESMVGEKTGDITVTIDGDSVTIPSDCYDIVEYSETITGDKFVPHVIEPSYGLDRILYCILEQSFQEIEKNGENYRLLRLHPEIAPIKAGVFPLISNDRLVAIAKTVDKQLRNHGILTYYDDGGTIGRRYARMDEIGTPFCVTIDHESIEDNAVTIRERDTTKQERIAIADLPSFLLKELKK
jgi:glycyl-tRNA synthetase